MGPISLTIPQEFYEDLDRRIRKAVLEALGTAEDAQSSRQEKYLTRKQVCQLLNISLPTLSSYYNQGILKGHKIGNRVLFEEQHIKDALHDLPLKYTRR